MFSFNDNRKSVNEIYTMFDQGKLVVDDSYQRRAVWGEKDKVRLIETILLNLVIPQLFFWKAETDPETGVSITHIVDGQQRIKAIYSFVNNEYKLTESYLMDKRIKENFANKYFRDLDDEVRRFFWNYQLMIIDIDPVANRSDIMTMFNRLNLTDYNLNDQEKRNSISGEFAVLARELSENPIWEENRFFTNTDVKRMRDVEFCASLILLYKKGIVDQTDQSALNQAYENFKENYTEANDDKEAVYNAIEALKIFLNNKNNIRFLRRKVQLYTVFSLIFFVMREEVVLEGKHIDNFTDFVGLYVLFNNDMDLSNELNDVEKTIFELLKKYKLASSEGLNKHTNRMIRLNVLKTFVFDFDENNKNAQKSLREKMNTYLRANGEETIIDLFQED